MGNEKHVETIGDYELEALIGGGMSGTVWRARRLGPLARTVALKRAVGCSGGHAVEAHGRLRAEATLLADLDHPHIIDVLDVLEDGDGVAIVMQWAQGGSLRALLDQRRTLSAGQVVAVLAPVADALASAHRRGLLHGDVKPSNILFTSDGEPLLSDFGAARHLARSAVPGDPVTGTAPYLDPELLDGMAPGPGSDLYALGATCYEALLGVLPHEGSTGEILRAADVGRHRPVSDVGSVPAPLAELVERAISRNSSERPASVEEFADELRASVDAVAVQLPGTPAEAVERGEHPRSVGVGAEPGMYGTRMFGPRPPRPNPETARPAPRRAVAIALLCGLVLVLAGAAWLRRGDRDIGRPRPAPLPTRVAPPCPTLPKLPVTPRARRFKVDVNGDGCPVPAAWDGRVLALRFEPRERHPRYYEIGSPSDVLLFGDWDCDRAETPALYRPREGKVIYVNTFGRQVGDKTYAERITDNLPERGSPRVEKGGDGCEVVHIVRPRS